MATTQLNYIAGEWVAGSSEVENRNPSDISDLIGMYAQASSAQLDDALLPRARLHVLCRWQCVGAPSQVRY